MKYANVEELKRKGEKQMSNRECGEIVCHCNVKENAELIAKIMDYDVDSKVCSDIAEVVRCKDCKHCEHQEFPSISFCHRTDDCLFEVDDDFYCKGGERKDTE